MKHDARRSESRGDFQAGYKPVLVRDELKESLRDWRAKNNLRDSHVERCLASACVQLAMQPENEFKLKQILASAVAKDFEISTSSAQAMRNHAPA